MQLREKYIAVTGGTAGTGLAIARALNAAGARVLIIGRNKTRLSELGHNGFATLAADIAQKSERDRVLAYLKDGGQALDVFVNNAGSMTSIALASGSAQSLMQGDGAEPERTHQLLS